MLKESALSIVVLCIVLFSTPRQIVNQVQHQ